MTKHKIESVSFFDYSKILLIKIFSMREKLVCPLTFSCLNQTLVLFFSSSNQFSMKIASLIVFVKAWHSPVRDDNIT